MRVFTAIDLPDEIRAEMAKVASELRATGVTPVKREAMHITLHFLGEVGDGMLRSLKGVMDTSLAGFSKFHISLKGLSHFPDSTVRVVFVGVAENADKIIAINTALADGLIERHLYSRHERYVPHATIARVKDRADRAPVLEAIKRYSGHDFGGFEVDSVVLKKSTLTGSGPAYEDLYRLKF